MSATKELHEKLRNFVDNTDPLVALKHLDNIDNQLREQTKLTSYMRRHALLDAVYAEGNQAQVGRSIGLSRQRTHDMVHNLNVCTRLNRLWEKGLFDLSCIHVKMGGTPKRVPPI